jgi:hypothetical protein
MKLVINLSCPLPLFMHSHVFNISSEYRIYDIQKYMVSIYAGFVSVLPIIPITLKSHELSAQDYILIYFNLHDIFKMKDN